MKYIQILLVTLICGNFTLAQVGVNTATVDPTAALEIQFGTTPKGMLTPRMTTAQRISMSTPAVGGPEPADGLLVYDTDLRSFFHYQRGTPAGWVRMSSEVSGRTNFKRIKSVTDLAAEKVGTAYVLKTDTYYEINGTVSLDLPIDLNNAYLVGLDANEDRLVRNGNVFVGAKGGTVKNLTISATSGAVFTLAGVNTETLILRDCIIAGSASVGKIEGFGLVFSSVVQFVNNNQGIEYSNIERVMLSNHAWWGNNNGSYEKYTGTFTLIQKLGGSCEVTKATAFGVDVSSNPVITGDAVLESEVFTGTQKANFVKGYTVGSYQGFNFNNSWTVDSPGIPRESDSDATGDINLDAAVGTGIQTSLSSNGPGSRKKIEGATTSNNLFRFTKDGDNRITYRGTKTRYFQVSGSVSYQGNNDLTLILYIARGSSTTAASVITQTKVYGKGTTGFLVSNGIIALPVIGTVQLKKDEFIELWVERFDGSGNMQTVSLNLIAR